MTDARNYEWLEVGVFARQQDKSPSTIRRWVKQHNLPHVRFGSRIMIRSDALDATLDALYDQQQGA